MVRPDPRLVRRNDVPLTDARFGRAKASRDGKKVLKRSGYAKA
jgi:hypothetical protein